MKYRSTRSDTRLSLSQAIVKGLADDGGLYIPEAVPKLTSTDFSGIFSTAAAEILKPFFADDALEKKLTEICKSAFDFPIPLKQLNENTALLELFHGPTAAFKDFGARFLAQMLSRIPSAERTVLVATSGDTGGAVAAAFYNLPGVQVGILFPKGMVSKRQQKQLTTWGGNIRAFSIRGTFDDCQRLVKSAFADAKWPNRGGLTSANSINIGRLLPQIAYFVYTSSLYAKKHGVTPGVIVPTGNLGNAAGAFYARAMGGPIGKIAIAVNANQTLSDYFSTGEWKPRPSKQTLANAMDVGDPSNMERLRTLEPDFAALKRSSLARSVSDGEISDTIRTGIKKWGTIFCPHTAVGIRVREEIKDGHWIVAATAHPAKFETIVEPLIGREVPLPESLKECLSRKENFQEIDASLDAFRDAWLP